VAIGIVTNNKDDSGLGRVKVRFPWRESTKRVTGRGLQRRWRVPVVGRLSCPKFDDEVLVAFEREDIGHPYIIGALWNGKINPRR